MRVIDEAFGLVGLLLVVLTLCGWWLARLLLPARWSRLEFLVAPFAGLFWIDAVSHTASWAGLSGTTILLVLGVLTIGLNGLALFRKGPPRLPLRTEVAVVACALPALLLALIPILASGHLLPIGDTNGDPVSHALMTEHLVNGSLRSRVPLGDGFKVWEPVYGKLALGIRLGFHFVQVVLDLLSGRQAFATFSLVSAAGLFLAAQAVFVLARYGLTFSRPVAYGSVLLTAVNAYLLWFHYGGYGPQVLGSGLFVLALAFWFAVLRKPCLRCSVWAAMMTAGLIGTYSEMLVLLLPTVCLAGMTRGVAPALRKDVTALKRLVMFFSLAALLAFLLNPVAGVRAVRRYGYLLDPSRGLGRGNVDWIVDPRSVLGLTPFGRYQGGAGVVSTTCLGPALMGLAAVLAGIMLIGATQVPSGNRGALLSLLIVHAVLQAGFLRSGHVYGYFKGWGFGLPVYLILLSAGVYGLYKHAADSGRLRTAILLGATLIVLLTGGVSLHLSLGMKGHLACTEGIAELPEALRIIPEGASIYTVTGNPHGVRVFWIAYFLRDHPAHFDARVIYTKETPRDYTDEGYILIHQDAQFDPQEHGLALEPVWSGLEFDLFKVRRRYY